MPNPVFVFGIVLATMYGLGCHVLLGGSVRRMVLFVISSWVGFLLGQYIGDIIGIELFRLGVLHLLPASVCSFIFLAFTRIITTETQGKVTRR